MTVQEAIEALTNLERAMERGAICIPHQEFYSLTTRMILALLDRNQADESVLIDAQEHVNQIRSLVTGEKRGDETQTILAA